jgi:hypothetical protein
MSSTTPSEDSSLQAKLARWSKRLASLPSLALPTDYPRPSPPRVVESLQSLSLTQSQQADLARLQSTLASSPNQFDVLLTAFILLLHRYTPDPSLLIGSSYIPPNSSSALPLLLLINIGPEETFESLLKQVLDVSAEAKRDAVPLEELEKEIKRSQPERGEGPLFRVRFLDGSEGGEGAAALGQEGMGLETDMTLVFGKAEDGGELFLLVPVLETYRREEKRVGLSYRGDLSSRAIGGGAYRFGGNAEGSSSEEASQVPN